MRIKTNKDTPLYTISTAAELLGISVHTLRMYEKEGLIVPFQKKSNHRLYSENDIERMTCIRHAINENKMSIAGINAIYSLIPCWDIVKCNEADRKNCLAYNNHSKPCWSYKHDVDVCSTNVCRDCKVYKNYADCGKIKTVIQNISREQ